MELIEQEFTKTIHVPYLVAHHTAPEIIGEISEAGLVTPGAAAKLLKIYSLCLEMKSHIILNFCSSTGEIAEAAKEVFRSAGIIIIRIDEAMCRQAVKDYSRVGVMGTLQCTLKPSAALVEKCAAQICKTVKVLPILAGGGFNKSQKDLDSLLCETAQEHKDKFDVLVLAQASMAFSEEAIAQTIGKPVFSSPRFTAGDVTGAAEKIWRGLSNSGDNFLSPEK
jgi:hypothetical protein